MLLFFTNDSKQKKKLIETDYVEDIYDVIESFFEDHGFRPHFVKTEFEPVWKISFGSTSEYFFVENYSQENIDEAKEYIQEERKE